MITASVLIVDDEPQILRFLKPSLEAAGYKVLTAVNGAEAIRTAGNSAPEAVLLDLGLPDMDGKDVIKRLRAWSKVPIIVLSARDREAEKVAALDLGADDYVEKPFGMGELLARLRAALRHASREARATTRFEAQGLVVDVSAHTVTRDGEPLKLTPKEFDLLVLLMRSAGRVVTHRQILTAVWGPAHTEDTQYLRVLVGQLRPKLKRDAGSPEVIATELGIGYRFIP
ncbi:MAG: response regulator [Hyphomicrobium sp.]|jgi:two-component system KDP operon response regulator KdpE